MVLFGKRKEALAPDEGDKPLQKIDEKTGFQEVNRGFPSGPETRVGDKKLVGGKKMNQQEYPNKNLWVDLSYYLPHQLTPVKRKKTAGHASSR